MRQAAEIYDSIDLNYVSFNAFDDILTVKTQDSVLSFTISELAVEHPTAAWVRLSLFTEIGAYS